MTGTEADGVRFERTGDVWEVELARAPCNEIGESMLASLERMLDAVEPSGARALVLYSSVAKGFSAGADLRGLLAAIEGRAYADYRESLAAFIARIHRVMDRLDTLPMTTVGALHGVCFGGGFELALTCDVLVADRSTRFCFPELRLGLIPGFGGVPRLSRELPNALVRDLLLTGRSLGAKRAAEIGLVSQRVAPGQALEVARQVAQQASLFDPVAATVAKRFAKPIPRQALVEEQQIFLRLFEQPTVVAALREFVARTDAMPYQPRGEGRP